MPIFISGRTKCALCNQVIDADPVMFPAFLPAWHDLFEFADRAFHRDCYVAWPLKDRFEVLYQAYDDLTDRTKLPTKELEGAEQWLRQQLAIFDEFARTH